MAIFISYSRADTAYVDKLALALIKARAHVWVDRWEIRVGDSLLDRIQAAIGEASALIVVLSKASVASEWCRRELNAGLIRELEEKRVLVLPVLLEDCDAPIFLKDKLYADFRKNFKAGLKQVLASVSGIVSDSRSRLRSKDDTTDYAMDWGTLDDQPALTFTFVQQPVGKPFTGLAQVEVVLNDIAAARMAEYNRIGLDWLGRHILAGFVAEALNKKDLRLLLSTVPDIRRITVEDASLGFKLSGRITGRLLGEDPGHDVLVNVGALLTEAAHRMRAGSRPLTTDEVRKVQALQRKKPGA